MSTDGLDNDCPRCKDMQEEVYRLTMERQLLLERLAGERERANALFVSYPPQGRAELAPPPSTELAPAGDKPLRYHVVDSINDAIYRLPGYELVRRAARALTKP